jgi:16S rRNA (guanine1516-N2)-methyltransferase
LARELSEASARVRLIRADAMGYLRQMSDGPDVVYLDPMFPARKKSALPGRELQALARLVGHGETGEAEALLAAALASGARRVAVKRSDDGAPLTMQGRSEPDVQFAGRTVRFDVYLNPDANSLQNVSEVGA